MAEWTDEAVSILRKHYREGVSASVIAAMIGGFTRHAVIGKAHRLGLVHKKPRGASAQKRGPAPRSSGASMVRPTSAQTNPNLINRSVAALKDLSAEMKLAAGVKTQPLPTFTEAVTNPIGMYLLDLEPHHCRWPTSSDEDGYHLFCGRQKQAGAVYCSEHFARAYQVVAKYRSKDRQAA